MVRYVSFIGINLLIIRALSLFMSGQVLVIRFILYSMGSIFDSGMGIRF